MNTDDVRAVIASARNRGPEPLDRFIGERMTDPAPGQVEEARVLCIEIIESVPGFLELAAKTAEDRALTELVDPILEHANRYFVTPIDMIPEMTFGLAGLLDDSYLVLRVLRNLDGGPEPFLDWNLDEPIAFLEELLGEAMTQRLDTLADHARRDAEIQLVKLWDRIGADA